MSKVQQIEVQKKFAVVNFLNEDSIAVVSAKIIFQIFRSFFTKPRINKELKETKRLLLQVLSYQVTPALGSLPLCYLTFPLSSRQELQYVEE